MYATPSTSPNTRVFGAATAVVITLGIGYALIVTTMESFVPPADKPLMLLPALQPDKPPLPPEPVFNLPDDTIVRPDDPIPIPIPIPDFVQDTPVTPPIAAANDSTSGTPASAGASGAATVILKPQLLPGDKPPYPPASVRAREQGVTSLSVCVSANGRVSEAKLTGSSGHERLDRAALDWVRQTRFSPGRVDGQRRTICGHVIQYVWRLEDAR